MDASSFPDFIPPHYTPKCAQMNADLFFSEDEGDISTCKRVCLRCPLRAACLEWALKHDEEGVWGMTTKEERNAGRTHSEGE